MKNTSKERLADLLIDPRESLEFEVKNWLNLKHSGEDKATFAKAVLAISNHGGGFIALGLQETDEGIVEAEGRPEHLDGYSQDLVNGIVQNYCDPHFHCAVHIVPNPVGALFPIVIVPGGHRFPIRARRAGPKEKIVAKNAYYIRRPGPCSETPQSAQDWEELLERCLQNQRDKMFDQIRDLFFGTVPQVEQQTEPARLDEWADACLQRWQKLIEPLPASVGPRLVHGRYYFAYEITGKHREVAPSHIPNVLKDSEVRHTGWPPFWYPTRNEIEPYHIDGAVECWLGRDTRTPVKERDAALSDFWRIHPDGLAFLIRGFQEDGVEAQRLGYHHVEPGKVFDISIPVWRVGETLLHARSLANNLFVGPTAIRFIAIFEGLAGRSLISIDGRRDISVERVAHQDVIKLDKRVDTQSIDPNLPEIVHPLLSPLYALFNFFELPMKLVVDELRRLRKSRL